ncbi:hypothetical protein [Actinoplanes rectilineatus]|uniref:hypothetical protein n=1 Tax=Actinoplanes rectilineatus TaxID=113571 RepID=UPI000ADA9AFC|nr:hypothetical protein [Actinoplanes rectilineatus]
MTDTAEVLHAKMRALALQLLRRSDDPAVNDCGQLIYDTLTGDFDARVDEVQL